MDLIDFALESIIANEERMTRPVLVRFEGVDWTFAARHSAMAAVRGVRLGATWSEKSERYGKFLASDVPRDGWRPLRLADFRRSLASAWDVNRPHVRIAKSIFDTRLIALALPAISGGGRTRYAIAEKATEARKDGSVGAILWLATPDVVAGVAAALDVEPAGTVVLA